MTVQRQAIVFAALGIAWNAFFYALFVILTGRFGTEAKLTMSVLYVLGIAASYASNRWITFQHRGRHWNSMLKFICLYAGGYLVNLAGLWLLIERFHSPAWLAQGFLMGLLAVGFFVLQRAWIFTPSEARALSSINS
jgi:putative flippase GtrA